MASGTNATKRHKLDFSDPLLLIVGRGDAVQTFYFPRSLIARSACIRNLQKVHDKRLHFDAPIELPDVDPAVFSIYYGLLVQNTVVTPEVDLETAWCLLVKAYILSRRITDTQAANSIMKEIINRLLAFNGVPDDRALVPAINHVFDRTVESGNSIKLRRLFIDYTVCISGGVMYARGPYSEDFLLGVIRGYQFCRPGAGAGGQRFAAIINAETYFVPDIGNTD